MPTRVFLGLLLFSSLSAAQTYTYSVTTGSRQCIADLRPNAQLVYPPPKDDTLSAWQTIPFAWNFYGKPVTGFYISDNGYITFDSLAGSSVPDNTPLPDPAAPNSAIYGYWDDLHLSPGAPQWSNEVRTLLWGTAPDRVLVIMWIGVVPKGVEWSSSNNVSFAIALMEGGDFDVVFVAGRSTVRMSGTVGAENADGTGGTLAEGPDFPYPAVSADPNDDISYRFSFSSRAYDASVIRSTLPPIARKGSPVNVGGTIKNMGTATLAGVTINYRVDESPAVSQSLSVSNFATNGTADFVFNTAWTPGEAGRMHTLRLWGSDLDGHSDENPVNDTLVVPVFVNLGTTARKQVLVEEFTGAWCGWCPDGSLQMQLIEAQEPRAVLVSIHAGGADSMILPEGAAIAADFNPAYPQAMIDRVQFPGEVAVPIGRGGNAWLARARQRLIDGAPLALTIDPVYDPATRTITAEVTVEFTDYPYPGDLRLNVFIIEDRVIGSGKGYDQSNYYSRNSSYPNHPYYSESNPIVGFVHRHVLRAVPTGTWGEPITLPHAPGARAERKITFNLPTSYRETEISLAAFASYFDASLDGRTVLNAIGVPLMPRTSVTDPSSAIFSAGEITPNPVVSRGVFSLRVKGPVAVEIALYNVLGERVRRIPAEEYADGVWMVPVDARGLRPGAYFVRVSTGTETAIRRFILIGP